jgi:F-box-like
MRRTSILDLPPETLGNIFCFYVEALYLRYYFRDDGHIIRYLLAITHVCQAFRTVALDCSELWCNVSLAKPEILNHLLHYSKSRPLYISISD